MSHKNSKIVPNIHHFHFYRDALRKYENFRTISLWLLGAVLLKLLSNKLTPEQIYFVLEKELLNLNERYPGLMVIKQVTDLITFQQQS